MTVMFELVPSKYMRDYFQKVGFTFTDFQKATLIWNMPEKLWREKLNALRELAESTNDAFTRRQITERVEAEEKKKRLFDENPDNRFVYVVEDRNDYACGFFASCEMAVEYAAKYVEEYREYTEYEERCSIKKQRIVRNKADLRVKNDSGFNPYFVSDWEIPKIVDYSGESVASLYLDAEGRIRHLWSNELSEEEEAIINEFRRDRFESQYIKIPYEMKTGWQVKDVTDGSFYVLDTGKEIWDNDMKRVDQDPKFYDFSDVQVVVFRLTKSGVWSHEHINPMYLTVESVPDAPGDERQQAYKKAMEALSDYFSVEKSDKDAYGKAGAYALECSREYAAVCRRQQWDVKELENAEDVEKILH